MSKIVVSSGGGRLGFRLTMLLNVMRIAKENNIEFKVVWSHYFGAEVENYPEIFSEEFIAEHFIDVGETNKFVLGRDKLNIVTLGNFMELTEGMDIVTVKHPKPIGREPGHPDTDPGDIYRNLFSEIGFHPVIREIQAVAAKKIGKEEFIALHIRRGDILGDRFRHHDWRHKFVPQAVYEKYIELSTLAGLQEKKQRRRLKKVKRKFIVFSDDFNLVRQIKSKFDNVYVADDIYGSENLTELQTALRDIIMMSNCTEIIGPPGSAFSTVAAMIVGRERLDILQLVPEEEQDVVLRPIIDEPAPSDQLERFARAQDYLFYGALLTKKGDPATAYRCAALAMDLEPENNFAVGLVLRYIRDGLPDGDEKYEEFCRLFAIYWPRVEGHYAMRPVNPLAFRGNLIEVLKTAVQGARFMVGRPDDDPVKAKLSRVLTILLGTYPDGDTLPDLSGPTMLLYLEGYLALKVQGSGASWIERTAALDERKRMTTLSGMARMAVDYDRKDLVELALRKLSACGPAGDVAAQQLRLRLTKAMPALAEAS